MFLYVLHVEHRNTYSTRKVKASLGSEDVLVAPHNFKGQLEGQDKVLRLRLG